MEKLYRFADLSPSEKEIAADDDAMLNCGVVVSDLSCRERIQAIFPGFDPERRNAIGNNHRYYLFAADLAVIDEYLQTLYDDREAKKLKGEETIYEFMRRKQIPPFLTKKGRTTAAVMIHIKYKRELVKPQKLYIPGQRFDGPTVYEQVLRGDEKAGKLFTRNPVQQLKNVLAVFEERKAWIAECTVYYTSYSVKMPNYFRYPLRYNAYRKINLNYISQLINHLQNEPEPEIANKTPGVGCNYFNGRKSA
jgi:hypothetical protein